MRFANKEKVYVASYKEIVIGFLTFALILFVLYPKNLILEQILQEKSNYDLSVLYLKNMLRNDPHNEKLILTLAQKSIKSQNRDLALHLLELLKKSPHTEVQQQAYLLSYELLKQNYFFLQNKHDTKGMQKLRKELQDVFLVILNKHFYKKNDIDMLYKEAMFLQSKEAQYLLLKQKLQTDPHDVKMLSDAYYLALAMKKYDAAFGYLDTLTRLDAKHAKKWKDAHYFLLTQIYNYKELEKYLLQKAEHSSYWQKRIIQFYLAHKKYKKAAAYYMHLFEQAKSYHAKRDLWLKAVKTLQSGDLLDDAVQLGSQYEDYFIQSKKARMTLLKLYISANKLKKANALSQKILQQKR